MPGSILVTGDIVLDCHLYGGIKTAATSLSEPGTTYFEELGGAVLSKKLLAAAADHAGARWDADRAALDDKNKQLVSKGEQPLPLPLNLSRPRPSPAFRVDLAFDDTDLAGRLPTHLHSYGVWTDRPVKKDSSDRVWRVDRHFGYGAKKDSDAPTGFEATRKDGPASADLVFIDDGGILFRHEGSPFGIDAGGVAHYVLKMSRPLCRGALWSALEPVRDRLVVVVSSDDLRSEDVGVSDLSWERCAEDTLRAIQEDDLLRELSYVADVIVGYSAEGALWISRGSGSPVATLLCAPDKKEGEASEEIDGSAYGFNTCFAVGIAFHLMKAHAAARAASPGKVGVSPFDDATVKAQTLQDGIVSGLVARKALRELGHGPIESPEPGFPVIALGAYIASTHGGFVRTIVPARPVGRAGLPWSILAAGQTPAIVEMRLKIRAETTARYGLRALSDVPILKLGKMTVVDRTEIESLRTLRALVRDYVDAKVQTRPLSLGVFGPPGAGKSFGVKALAKSTLGKDVPLLEFNLSQFRDSSDLVGALHQVRDAVLRGVTPVAFFDEFDSRNYEWLQYLLAPMQDGAFQEGQISHPVGKCIFVFAGGTSPTLDAFKIVEPKRPANDVLRVMSPEVRADCLATYRDAAERYRRYQLAKGPDFVSRLHGFLNVLGCDAPPKGVEGSDVTWMVRRALLLRSVLDLADHEELDIDPGLLQALLMVPEYSHGARSLEKIARTLKQRCGSGRLGPSGLPPEPLLRRETDAIEFHKLLTSRVKNPFQ